MEKYTVEGKKSQNEMTLTEAKKILKSITMACWWKCKKMGIMSNNNHAILAEAKNWLERPIDDTNQRLNVEQACAVMYRQG